MAKEVISVAKKTAKRFVDFWKAGKNTDATDLGKRGGGEAAQQTRANTNARRLNQASGKDKFAE